MTKTESVMGTPSYMSPEQGTSTKGVGTSADIWSLGVILYECITGSLPFVGADVIEVLDNIRHKDPVPPSEKVKCPRDLETICLKCLRKDPRDRYATAQALADDLRAFLEERSISARPMGRMEKSAKWVRKNPSWAAMILALMLGAGVAIWQANRANAEASSARQAAAELKIALSASEEARTESKEILQFLRSDVLDQAAVLFQRNNGFEPNPNLTVREALERAAVRIDDRFRDRPRIKAHLHFTIGNAFRALGESEKSVAQLTRASELYAVTDGPENLETTLVAMKNLAQALFETGRQQQAIPILEKLLTIYTRDLGPENEWALLVASNLAEAELECDRKEDAIARMEKICHTHQHARGEAHPATRSAKSDLVQAYATTGQIAKAEGLQTSRVSEMRKLEVAGPELAGDLSLLGWLHLQLGNVEKAAAVLRESLKIRDKLEPERWNTDFTRAMLGAALTKHGERSEVEKLLLAGHAGLAKRETSIPAGVRQLRLNESIRWLVAFYEAEGRTVEAMKWRLRLDAKKGH